MLQESVEPTQHSKVESQIEFSAGRETEIIGRITYCSLYYCNLIHKFRQNLLLQNCLPGAQLGRTRSMCSILRQNKNIPDFRGVSLI